MRKKILISPTSFAKYDQRPLELLKGYEVVLNPYKRKMSSEEVIKLGKDCVGIIAGIEPLNSFVFENMPNLKCISRVGVGLDNIDIEKAKKYGIVLRNTPGGPTIAVAELTIGLILNLLRKISLADKNMHNGIWKKETGYLLNRKKVGIIGMGNIGKAVAKLLLAFGCKVITNDINPDDRWLKKYNLVNLSKEELLKNSDVFCLHLSHLAGHQYVMDDAQLDLMKKGSFLINMSRGGIVCEESLVRKLESGHLAGAALDVYENEPYQGPLRGMENVILTPHIGSYAREARFKMEIGAVNNLLEEI